MLKHHTSICNVDFSIIQCSYFPALTLTALHAEDNKLTSLARWANSVSKISNGYESSSGFVIVISNNWDFLMSGFPPSTQKHKHTWLVLHRSGLLHKCRKPASIMESKQERDPEIAQCRQEFPFALWCKSPLCLHTAQIMLSHTHTHAHTRHLKQVFQFHSWTPRALVIYN